MSTPIEQLADILDSVLEEQGEGVLSDILIPEQCCLLCMNGKTYHVTIEELK